VASVWSPIVELRQYTLHAGGRDVLIDLFERQFVTSQEAVGIRVFGRYRDLDDPNRFVWMRGFPDMTARAAALGAFYGGPAWAAHRTAANATILDSDNVLLLRPSRAGAGMGWSSSAPSRGLVVAEIRYLDREAAPAFAAFFAEHMRSPMAVSGGRILGVFETEASPNSFPRLPIREGVTVLVALLGFADMPAYLAYRARLARGPDWREAAPETLLPQFMRKPEVLRLEPARHR
jgi:hypothetical protein